MVSPEQAAAIAARQERVAELMRQGRSYHEIALALGVSDSLASRDIRAVRRRSMSGFDGTEPVLDGFEITQTSTQIGADGETIEREWIKQRPARGEELELPRGHVVKGISALVDQDDRVIQKWVKTKQGELAPEAVVEILQASMDGWSPRPFPPPVPPATNRDLLTLVPVNDWHLGMYSWHREADESWDLGIAEERLRTAVESVISMSPPSGTGVVLVGGDLLHADNMEARTAKSGNVLDVDGRYAKVLETAGRLMVDTVYAAATRYENVIVRVLRGNHDDHSALAVSMFLKGWFRDVEHVLIDADPGLFWWHRHGSVLLGSTHGHTIKPDQMPGIMASRRAQEWGLTRFRYAHTFHLHHKRLYSSEEGGVITEVHQAPIPADAWHHGAGYLSGRSMQAITYHRDAGETARVRIALT